MKINASKKSSVWFMLFVLFITVAYAQQNNNIGLHGKKPNIIYINVDDMGVMDTEVYGSTFYETPHINTLAESGMTFSRGYAGAANCAPSRACLMSGLNTPRHGIYTVDSSARGNEKTRKLIPIENTKILADSIITIAEALKENGYATATFGKWHLGNDPLTQGFDVNFGGGLNGNPGKKGYFSPYNVPNLIDGPEGENLTDRLTNEAINYMDKLGKKPFFVYLTYYAVHGPLQTFDALEEKYKKKGGNEYQNNATYAGMVETLDSNVGKVLQFLKDAGLEKNTLVIFTSDNGGIRDISNQFPYRAGKGSYYEGGIREPFIMKWPDHIKANIKCDVPMTNLDILPTLYDVAGGKMENLKSDGNSLTPLFQGANIKERDLFFHFPIYLQAYNPKTDDARDPLFRTRPGSVIISGNWKLHQYFEDNGLELYNLDTDQGERTNLVEQYPEKAKELLSKLDTWRASVHAPIPQKLNPKYDSAFESKK